jgi:putative ABC transport system permease protein
VTVLCGLLPATHVVRLAIAEGMKGHTAALRTRWLRAGMREALIVIQVTASIALLLVSALFARGLAAGAAASPGFTIDGIVTIGIELGAITDIPAATVAERMLAAVAAVPGVDNPAIAGVIQLIGSSRTVGVQVGDAEPRSVAGDVVSPGYLRTMGMRLLRGRDITDRDRLGAPAVALVSETFARTYFKTADAVGRTVLLGRDPVEIVGVTADVRYRSVSEPYQPLIYLPFAQRPNERFLIHARVRGGGETFATIEAAARSVDPRILIDGAVPLSRRLEEIRMPERVSGWIGTAAGIVQFGLVLMALWGLVAYAVARRTREIGVRMALGATPAGLVAMLMRPALLLIGMGAILGTGLGIAGATVMHSQFDGLAPVEPGAGLPAIVVMATVAAAAALVPALRATRVDPNQTLRAE